MIRAIIVRAILACGVLIGGSINANAEVHVNQALPAYLGHGVLDLKKSVEVAQANFEDSYFQTLVHNEKFFDDAYNNNLVVSTDIDWDFTTNGPVFMRLLELLESKEDSGAQLMLEKLNELFYLIFHRHLAHSDLPREKQVELVQGLHYLFNVKNAKDVAVLRTHLTRIFIYAMMVEFMGLHYHEKKEILFFAYEDFRTALKSSVVDCSNEATTLKFIDTFINDLAAYGMKEPIIKPKNVQKWLIMFVVAGVIVGIGVIINHYFETWDKFIAKSKEFLDEMTKTFSEGIKKNLLRPSVKEMFDEMERRGPKLGASMVEGLVYEDIDAPEVDLTKKRPNKKTQKMAEDMGANMAKGMTEGLVYEDIDAPEVDLTKKRRNRNTQKLAVGMGKNLGKGLSLEAAPLMGEVARGLVEVPTKEQKRKLRKNRVLAEQAERDEAAAEEAEEIAIATVKAAKAKGQALKAKEKRDVEKNVRDARAARDKEFDKDDGDGEDVSVMGKAGNNIIDAAVAPKDKKAKNAPTEEISPAERIGEELIEGIVSRATTRKLRVRRSGLANFDLEADPIVVKKVASSKGRKKNQTEGPVVSNQDETPGGDIGDDTAESTAPDASKQKPSGRKKKPADSPAGKSGWGYLNPLNWGRKQ